MGRDLGERFWSKVDKNGPTMPHMDTECWVWTGSKAAKGYGHFWDGTRVQHAHRVAMKLQGIPLADDELGCHHCDNPPCVRGRHLFAGTHKTNAEDRSRKGRSFQSQIRRCPQDHEYSEANTFIHPTDGRRFCRACNRERQRLYRARKAAA